MPDQNFTDPAYFFERFKENYRRMRPGMDCASARQEAYVATVKKWPLCQRAISLMQMQIVQWVTALETKGTDT